MKKIKLTTCFENLNKYLQIKKRSSKKKTNLFLRSNCIIFEKKLYTQ